jgi:methionyl-tRNA formyltransferase
MSHRVIIFCPNPYSLYTTTVATLLLRQNVQVLGIVVKKFTLARFRQEFARDGKRLLRKIYNKLVLREGAYQARSFETIVSFRQKHGINAKSIQQLGVPVHTCYDLNDDKVAELLKSLQPDLVVFTGGGIVREKILKVAGQGVLNCHMGKLPHYRGMDVVEWPLLQNDPDNLGFTVHFMDTGIDTGDILRVENITIDADIDGIKMLREKYEPRMAEALAQTTIDFLEGKISRQKQHINDGQQYFIMHDRLLEIANANLKKIVQQQHRPA